MPIEIKELVVKFNVIDRQEQEKQDNNVSISNYKEIVKECTENVLREIEKKLER